MLFFSIFLLAWSSRSDAEGSFENAVSAYPLAMVMLVISVCFLFCLGGMCSYHLFLICHQLTTAEHLKSARARHAAAKKKEEERQQRLQHAAVGGDMGSPSPPPQGSAFAPSPSPTAEQMHHSNGTGAHSLALELETHQQQHPSSASAAGAHEHHSLPFCFSCRQLFCSSVPPSHFDLNRWVSPEEEERAARLAAEGADIEEHRLQAHRSQQAEQHALLHRHYSEQYMQQHPTPARVALSGGAAAAAVPGRSVAQQPPPQQYGLQHGNAAQYGAAARTPYQPPYSEHRAGLGIGGLGLPPAFAQQQPQQQQSLQPRPLHQVPLQPRERQLLEALPGGSVLTPYGAPPAHLSQPLPRAGALPPIASPSGLGPAGVGAASSPSAASNAAAIVSPTSMVGGGVDRAALTRAQAEEIDRQMAVVASHDDRARGASKSPPVRMHL
jgi:hypothetical protein